MHSKFKKVFRFFFLIVSAIVFLFVFFPERILCKTNKRKERMVQRKQQSILKKRVYYTKERVSENTKEDS